MPVEQKSNGRQRHESSCAVLSKRHRSHRQTICLLIQEVFKWLSYAGITQDQVQQVLLSLNGRPESFTRDTVALCQLLKIKCLVKVFFFLVNWQSLIVVPIFIGEH